MIHLGEADIRYSFTSHFTSRWRERVDPYSSIENIKFNVGEIVKLGNRYPVDNIHYRICFNGLCIVFMQLSPLHSLAKTVYLRDESTLGAE